MIEFLDEERRHASEYPEEISEDEDIPMSFGDVIEDQEELQHSKKRRKGSDLPDFAKVLGIWTDTQKIIRDGYQALREILATSEDSNIRSIPNTLKTLQERCRDELPLLPLFSSTISLSASNQPTGKQSGSSSEVFYINSRLTVAMILSERIVNRKHLGLLTSLMISLNLGMGGVGEHLSVPQ
ncbi:hypothetical protein K3495_g9696 [Podosphaera aphanis]|nr:hypothetical protein K3495_g9696 [Podosphaera aphanis]